MVYNESKNSLVAAFAQFFAWIIASILTIVDIFAVREALLSILAVFRVFETAAYHRAGGVGQDMITGFGITAFDSVMLLLMSLGVVVAVIWIEYYFRKGRPRGLLYNRIGKVAFYEVAIVIVSVIIRVVMMLILQANPG